MFIKPHQLHFTQFLIVVPSKACRLFPVLNHGKLSVSEVFPQTRIVFDRFAKLSVQIVKLHAFTFRTGLKTPETRREYARRQYQ